MAGPPGPTGGCRILLPLFISIRSRGESLLWDTGTSWTGLPSFCDTKIAVLRYKISTYASYASRRSFSRRDTEDGSFLYSFSDPDAGAEKKVKNVK